MNQWFGHLVLSSMGLAAAGVLVVLIRLCWRRDPIACYRMLVVLLVAALALPILQISIQGRAAGVTPTGEQLLAKVWWTEHAVVPVEDSAPNTILDVDDNDAPTSRASSPEELLALLDTARASGPFAGMDGFAFPTTEEVADPEGFAEALRPPLTAPDPILRGRDWSAHPLAPWLAVLWSLGVVAFGAWHAARIARTMAVIRRSRPLTSTRLLELWRWVTLGRHRGVRLVVSDEITSPAYWGVIRPVLMLPAHDLDHTDDRVLEWAMRHELVHIRRGDARTAVIQSLLTTLFWFHPVAWWLTSQLDKLRELSCDDLVVRCNGKRRSYALALLDYACGRRPTNSSPLPTPGALVPWSGSASQLKRRIKMLEKTRDTRGIRDRLVAWTSVATMLATLWSGQLAIAATLFPAPQEEPQAPCVCDEPCNDEASAEAPSAPFASEALDSDAIDAVDDFPVGPMAAEHALARGDSLVPYAVAAVPGGTTMGGSVGMTGFALATPATLCDRRIGVKLKRVSDALASHLGVSTEGTLLIDDVAKGSPAHRAGIKRHDVLVSVDRRSPVTVDSLRKAVRTKSIGDEVRLEIVRRGEHVVIEVEVEDWKGEGIWTRPLRPGPEHPSAGGGSGGVFGQGGGVFGGSGGVFGVDPAPKANPPKGSVRARPGTRAPSIPGARPRRAPPTPFMGGGGVGRSNPTDEAENGDLKRALDSLEKTRKSLQKYIDKLEKELREAERDLERNSQRRSRSSRGRRTRRTTRAEKSQIDALEKQLAARLEDAEREGSRESVQTAKERLATISALNAQQHAAAAQVEAALATARARLDEGNARIEAETEARVRDGYARAIDRLRGDADRINQERERLRMRRDAVSAQALATLKSRIEKECSETSKSARRLYGSVRDQARKALGEHKKRRSDFERAIAGQIAGAEHAEARERAAIARELARTRRDLGVIEHESRAPRSSSSRRHAVEIRPSPPREREARTPIAPVVPEFKDAGPVQKHEHRHFHEHIHRLAEDGDDDVKTRTRRIELSLRDLQSRLDREGRELGAARIATSVSGCKDRLDPAVAEQVTEAVSKAVSRKIRVSLDRDSQHIVLTMPDRDEVDAIVRRCLQECAPELDAPESIVEAVRTSTADQGKLVGIAIETLAPARRAALDAVQTEMDVIEIDIRRLVDEEGSTLPRAVENGRSATRLE